MTTATHTRTIETSAADVWRVLADFAHVDLHHPAVERVSTYLPASHKQNRNQS